MKKSLQPKKLLTIKTTKGDITCEVTPCIGISLSGSSREYFGTRYSVSVNGKALDYYHDSIWLKEGIDAKGRTLKISRGFNIGCLFPDRNFESPAHAKINLASLKEGMEKVIKANGWNVVDTQS